MGWSACTEWILNFVQEMYPLPQFLHLWGNQWSSLIIKEILAIGLSACAEWILNFVQEIAGVRTDPQRSWSTKSILFLSFLVSEAKTGPPETNVKKEIINCFHHRTVCMRWMDLELCTRDSWCMNWPRRELVHQAHSLPEFLGLWSKDWSSLNKPEERDYKMFWS